MGALVALGVLLPLLALATIAHTRLRRLALVAAPLPLAALGVLGEGALALPRLLVGTGFGVDAVNRPLLLLAGVGWILAGAFAGTSIRRHERGFHACWLLTLGGSAVALLGADLVTFYLGYVAMTLAAYGLVVHARSDAAWRAGRVYLVLALSGEALVLAGLLMLGAAHGNVGFAALAALEPVPIAPGLLMLGFAVKLGAVPLHVWLPLAHPVAPVPASAVLSGLLVKAGLLGMLRFVPAPALPPAELLLALGFFGAGYAAVVGLTQGRLKTVLAYSTISQMGLVVVGLGALAAGDGPGPALAALGLFALHHGLNKIALFLGAGHRLGGAMSQLAFLLPAAALAGLPFTSGALAKAALKDALYGAGVQAWALGLSLSSVLTALLLVHAWRLARRHDGREAVHPAWAAAAIAGLLLPWLWAWSVQLLPPVTWAGLWDGVWPLGLALAIDAGWRRWRGRPALHLPEGDAVVVLEALAARGLQWAVRIGDAWAGWFPRLPSPWPGAARLRALELAMARLPIAGLGLLGLVLLLWLALE